jgi:photosynthetic reaction center cytochrome c subunit
MKRSSPKPYKVRLLPPLLVVVIILFFAQAISQMERPPVGTIQRGPRGTGSIYLYNPRTMARTMEANKIPVSVPYSGDVGEKAGSYYENVQVLRDVNIGEFTRLMVNITTWVAPDQGCAACHNTANFAEDSKYTKVVARRMLQMVRHINSDWTAHVAKTGVTCYTCHRGQLVPPNVWFNDPGPNQAAGMSQKPAGKNHPSPAAAGSALPLDPYSAFLEADTDVRVQGTNALAAGNRHSIKQAQWTYSLMISMSKALGVNCTYCHHTRFFGDWSQSPPQRVTAWHGIRMVRDLNAQYLGPLKAVLPSERLGAARGDAPKVNCATCHNGVYKPLFGISMVQGERGFPELKGTEAAVAASSYERH